MGVTKRIGKEEETKAKTDDTPAAEKRGSNQPKDEEDKDKTFKTKKSIFKSKKFLLLVGCVMALGVAYAYKPFSKKELLGGIRDTLMAAQGLRDYGVLGWLAFVMLFVGQLTICLPGTMIVDVALGNVYGAILGTAASVTAKTTSAIVSLYIGRMFGKALGLEFPEMLRTRMGKVRDHPLKALFLGRMAPISTGVKNYAFSLLPPADVPLLQYALATILANLLVTTGVCIVGAGADNLVAALDKAMGGH